MTRRPGGQLPVWLLLITAAGLAGCAGNAGGSRPALPPDRSASVSTAAAGYGRDAATLTAQVAGCASARDLRVHQLASISPDLAGDRAASAAVASASSCALKGHPVLVLAFADAADQQTTTTAVRGWDAFYADGPGWLATAQQSQPAPAQESIVQSVAAALGGRIERGAAP